MRDYIIIAFVVLIFAFIDAIVMQKEGWFSFKSFIGYATIYIIFVAGYMGVYHLRQKLGKKDESQ